MASPYETQGCPIADLLFYLQLSLLFSNQRRGNSDLCDKVISSAGWPYLPSGPYKRNVSFMIYSVITSRRANKAVGREQSYFVLHKIIGTEK